MSTDHPVVRRLRWALENTDNPDTGKRWTKAQLGEAVGLSRGWVRTVLQGHTDPDRIAYTVFKRLAFATGLSLSWWLGESDAPRDGGPPLPLPARPAQPGADPIQSRVVVLAMLEALRGDERDPALDAAMAALRAERFSSDPGIEAMQERFKVHLAAAKSVVEALS